MISSPSRYFVRTSSSASEAASSSWSRRVATSASISGGMGTSTSWRPSQRYAFRWTRSTYPLNVSALPMASWSGAILLPNSARSASRTAAGSAFSRSHLLTTKSAAVRLARASETAVSVPASTPPVASMQMRAASVAWKPATTSATKSG